MKTRKKNKRMKIYIIDFNGNNGFGVTEERIKKVETINKAFRFKVSDCHVYGDELNSIWVEVEGLALTGVVYCTDKKLIFKYIDAMKKIALSKIDVNVLKLKELKKKVKKFN